MAEIRDIAMNIAREADHVVEVLGYKKKGEKLIKVYDEEGRVVDVKNTKTVAERLYEGFGFEISFLEESKALVAIWYCGELVFNLIEPADYDPDLYSYRSKLLMRLVDETSVHYRAGTVYVPGPWEEDLHILSANAERIKEKKEAIRRETELVEAFADDLNYEMNMYLNFEYSSRGWEHYATREYRDRVVSVRGVVGDPCLKVFTLSRAGEHCVFDKLQGICEDGPWREHLQNILAKNKARKQRDAARFGYDLEKERAEAKQEKAPEYDLANKKKKTPEEYHQKLMDFCGI